MFRAVLPVIAIRIKYQRQQLMERYSPQSKCNSTPSLLVTIPAQNLMRLPPFATMTLQPLHTDSIILRNLDSSGSKPGGWLCRLISSRSKFCSATKAQRTWCRNTRGSFFVSINKQTKYSDIEHQQLSQQPNIKASFILLFHNRAARIDKISHHNSPSAESDLYPSIFTRPIRFLSSGLPPLSRLQSVCLWDRMKTMLLPRQQQYFSSKWSQFPALLVANLKGPQPNTVGASIELDGLIFIWNLFLKKSIRGRTNLAYYFSKRSSSKSKVSVLMYSQIVCLRCSARCPSISASTAVLERAKSGISPVFRYFYCLLNSLTTMKAMGYEGKAS